MTSTFSTLMIQPSHSNTGRGTLITPKGRLIVCISASSALRVLGWDEDEEEWVDDEEKAHHDVHLAGEVVGTVKQDGSILVVFQDRSGHLASLDDSWIPQVLPATPVDGSPLSIRFVNDVVHIFYIAAGDGFVHEIFKNGDGWVDAAVPGWDFGGEAKRLMVCVNQKDGQLEAFVLTKNNGILMATTGKESEITKLGQVGSEGKYVPETSQECCPSIYGWPPIVIQYVPIIVWRPWPCW